MNAQCGGSLPGTPIAKGSIPTLMCSRPCEPTKCAFDLFLCFTDMHETGTFGRGTMKGFIHFFIFINQTNPRTIEFGMVCRTNEHTAAHHMYTATQDSNKQQNAIDEHYCNSKCELNIFFILTLKEYRPRANKIMLKISRLSPDSVQRRLHVIWYSSVWYSSVWYSSAILSRIQ